jgi:hypothetical protein
VLQCSLELTHGLVGHVGEKKTLEYSILEYEYSTRVLEHSSTRTLLEYSVFGPNVTDSVAWTCNAKKEELGWSLRTKDL